MPAHLTCVAKLESLGRAPSQSDGDIHVEGVEQTLSLLSRQHILLLALGCDKALQMLDDVVLTQEGLGMRVATVQDVQGSHDLQCSSSCGVWQQANQDSSQPCCVCCSLHMQTLCMQVCPWGACAKPERSNQGAGTAIELC